MWMVVRVEGAVAERRRRRREAEMGGRRRWRRRDVDEAGGVELAGARRVDGRWRLLMLVLMVLVTVKLSSVVRMMGARWRFTRQTAINRPPKLPLNLLAASLIHNVSKVK